MLPTQNDRNSPISSSEALSGPSSPQIIKLTTVPASKKQRSSSMNSVSSNHSTNQRSMSIISLESPRNSIVSIDDNFLRPTRNNSNTSLNSYTALSPNDSNMKDNYVIGNRKLRPKTSSAVFSDEDSELEIHISGYSRAQWRRRSSDKIQKPTFLTSLKKDFKFKYDNYLKPKVVPPASKFVEDVTPSPLSLSIDGSGLPLHHNHNVHLHTSTGLNPQLPEVEPDNSTVPARKAGKKLRTSSITQSIFLKKRMLLSKDIQLELLQTHGPPLSPTLPSADTRFPSFLQPPPLRGLIHNFLSLHGNEDAPQLPPSRNSPSPPLLYNVQSEPSFRQQNKLIYELNRKWNKAVFDDKRELAKMEGVTSPSRKRERSELISSTDSSAHHINHP